MTAVLAAFLTVGMAGTVYAVLHVWRDHQVRQVPRLRVELARHQALIEQLRETAWKYRETDPYLSPDLLDQISRFHNHREINQ